MCKIASYLKKTSDNWPFVVRTEKVRLFLFRAYNISAIPKIYQRFSEIYRRIHLFHPLSRKRWIASIRLPTPSLSKIVEI